MKKPYSRTLLRSQNGVHLKAENPLKSGISGGYVHVDPERFELSGSTLIISVYRAFSGEKGCVLGKHYSNSLANPFYYVLD